MASSPQIDGKIFLILDFNVDICVPTKEYMIAQWPWVDRADRFTVYVKGAQKIRRSVKPIRSDPRIFYQSEGKQIGNGLKIL